MAMNDLSNEQLESRIDQLIKRRTTTGGHGKRAWLNGQIAECEQILEQRHKEDGAER